MKILFCAYRPWAVNVYKKIKKYNTYLDIQLAKSEKEFYKSLNEVHPDVIIMVGWSWIIPQKVLETDLPEYAGGSPIQHQIIDGVTETKGSLFKASTKLDLGPIIYKEELDLSGNMTSVFNNLEKCATLLVSRFIKNYPEVPIIEQEENKPEIVCMWPMWADTGPQKETKVRKRLKPEDSKLTKTKLFLMSCEQLYNFIRCREEPYPNVYMEDSRGRIYFKLVEYEPKKDDK